MIRIKGIAALIESQEWGVVDEQLESGRDISPDERNLFRCFIGLLRDGNSFRGVGSRATNPENAAFEQFISGRVAAFVGPAKARQDDSLEIDRHDLVVRCNDVKKEGSSGVPDKGSRCDVSYYNPARVRSLAADSSSRFREDVRWAVAKDGASLRLLRQAAACGGGGSTGASDSAATRPRASRNYTPVLFHGALTAAPRAFLDLLEHGAASIRVFHTDLMLTVERSEGYDPRIQGREAHIDRGSCLAESLRMRHKAKHGNEKQVCKAFKDF